MWIADGWKDYELLDCGGGEKLERWGDQILVRPDPQAIWESDRKNRGWRTANARYSRSSTGGGHWDKNKLPESWPISYKSLRFQVKPMNFKHTGLFPEQAANWDFAMEQIRQAGRPIRVLNLFAYTGGATVACAAAGASVCHVDAAKGEIVPFDGDLKITSQCIRVPVLNGHTATVFLNFGKKATKEELVDRLVNYTSKASELGLPHAPKHFIQYLTEDDRPQVKFDVDYEGGMGVSIGRLREDSIFDWKFVGLAHNTLRGAAGGALECAEMLKALGYISAK